MNCSYYRDIKFEVGDLVIVNFSHGNMFDEEKGGGIIIKFVSLHKVNIFWLKSKSTRFDYYLGDLKKI